MSHGSFPGNRCDLTGGSKTPDLLRERVPQLRELKMQARS